MKHIFRADEYRAELQNYLGDIAILVTTKMFDLTVAVQPVCVDWYQQNEYNLTNGYVTGWGFTVEDSNPSEVLKELNVPVIQDSRCLDNFPGNYKQFFTFDKLCAGFLNSHKSVCIGDSGGGLVFEHNNKFYIKGVVSNTPRSMRGCDSQQYSLYTNVSKYLNFILDKETQFAE